MYKLPKVFTHRMGNGQKRLVVCATLQFENSFVLLSSPSNQLLMECTFEKYWLLRRVKWPRQPDQRSICSNTNCCVWPKRMIKSIQVYFCRLQYEQELTFKLFYAINHFIFKSMFSILLLNIDETSLVVRLSKPDSLYQTCI